jgi:hypothetical protein
MKSFPGFFLNYKYEPKNLKVLCSCACTAFRTDRQTIKMYHLEQLAHVRLLSLDGSAYVRTRFIRPVVTQKRGFSNILAVTCFVKVVVLLLAGTDGESFGGVAC